MHHDATSQYAYDAATSTSSPIVRNDILALPRPSVHRLTHR
jgi:hypothetical protein